MVQYRASKVDSYQAIIDFVQEHKPSFDVTTFHPSWVYGRNPVQEPHDNLSGSCGALVLTLLSPERPINGQFLGVHVDDVAAAHVKALGESTRGFQSFLLSAPRRSWEEVNAFVRHEYPSVAWRLIPEDWMNYAVDPSKAEKELGLRFKPMEDQVRDTVDQQLEFWQVAGSVCSLIIEHFVWVFSDIQTEIVNNCVYRGPLGERFHGFSRVVLWVYISTAKHFLGIFTCPSKACGASLTLIKYGHLCDGELFNGNVATPDILLFQVRRKIASSLQLRLNNGICTTKEI